jgi:hypothetical protein
MQAITAQHGFEVAHRKNSTEANLAEVNLVEAFKNTKKNNDTKNANVIARIVIRIANFSNYTR